ncbi:MAG: group 1 glycosyl transferase [Comamonadaceae bacterium]|nr:MAG: group 1 glycosyl transferase [Comamonadaceae bacterium]
MTETSRLKLALVTETFSPEVNGVAMTLGKLVEGLHQRGHRVEVVRPRQTGETALASNDPQPHILVKGIPIPTYNELRFGLPSKHRLIQCWRAKRPDIVHVATEGPLGWSAVAAAHALGIPVSSSFHTNFHTYSQHYGIGWIKHLIERYLRTFHNRTLLTMVPTSAMLHDLHSRGFDNLAVLSRGVETRQFSPTRRSQTLRDHWGIGPDDLVCLHVGRLAKEKNIGAVLAAFHAIQAQQPRAKLVLVGDGPLRPSLAQAFPECIFTGIQKGLALAEHYASSDVFLFPSLTETFGNVVPEALASGLAVVAFANGAAQELIIPHHNGLLAPLFAEPNFVNAAVAVASNSAKRQQMRANAASSVAHLGWDAVCDSFAQTLSRLVLQHSGLAQQTASAAPTLVINQTSA